MQRRLELIASILFMGAGIFLLGIVLQIMWVGGEVTFPVAAKNPVTRLVAGLVCLVIGYAFWVWRTHKRRDWLIWAGRWALVGGSVWIVCLVAEPWFRDYLRKKYDAGNLHDLAAHDPNQHIGVHSAQPMAAVVRVSANKRLVYELIPGLDREFGRKPLQTNADGFRAGREYAKPKPDSVRRIIGLGDSGLFGWGVGQGADWLSHLEVHARSASGKTIEALNFGVPGYNTQQEVDLLVDRGLAYQPDIVLVSWSRNDFNVPAFLQRSQSFDEEDLSYLFLLLFRRDELLNKLDPVVQSVRPEDLQWVDPQILEESGKSGVEQSLARLRGLAVEHDFHLLLVGPLDEPIRGICRRVGVETFDFRKEIPDGSYPASYNVHGIHPREAGHRVIGEKLAAELGRRGWL